MQTTVKAVSDTQVEVEVEVDAETVAQELSRQTRKVAKKARIKGFRAGKAPKAMVRKLYGEVIDYETSQALIEASFSEALSSVERRTVGQPEVVPGKITSGQPYRYKIVSEAIPEIELTRWKGIEVTVAPAVVDEARIDAEIAALRDRHKEQVPVEDRGADVGDILMVSTTGAVDGVPEPRLTTSRLRVKLGDSDLIPGFADQLMGARAGDERTIEVTFPEDYHAKELAGRGAVFEATVDEHFVEELPNLDDDFAQDAGFDTMEALRESIRARLQDEADRRRKVEIENKVMAVVLERNKFAVPASLAERQLRDEAQRVMLMAQLQGMPERKAREMVDDNLDDMFRRATATVRNHLALDALARQEGIEIDDQALNDEIVRRIEANEREAGRYEKEEEREALRSELRMTAALDLLRTHAKIVDAVPEEGSSDDQEASGADDAEETPKAEPAPETSADTTPEPQDEDGDSE